MVGNGTVVTTVKTGDIDNKRRSMYCLKSSQEERKKVLADTGATVPRSGHPVKEV